jgi:predicted metal-dependent phosphoesterase TrpH
MRSTQPTTTEEGQTRLSVLRRLPLWGIGITLLVLFGALASAPAVRDAVTGASVSEAALSFSPAYLALSPVFDMLDALALLSARDHVAVLVWVIAVFAAWRVFRRRLPAAPAVGRARKEAGVATLFVFAILLVYLLGAVAPRPMAQLTISGAHREDVLAIDVHSHTQYSHDGRPGWTPEDVRAWHRDAGYDVAYISDHRTFEGIERGIANNPLQAGQGMVLLPALEVVWHGEHVNILNAGWRFKGLTDPNLRDIDDQALTLASTIPKTEPVLVETFPGSLANMRAAHGPGTAGVRAIEIIDGDPRGLGQTRRERAPIVRAADSLDLALVAGSNNHGWGHTAPGWTLLRIPGWRGMGEDSLSTRIDRVLREGGYKATRVVERAGGTGDGFFRVLFALPVVVWRLTSTLAPDQRVMWLVWTWALVLFFRTTRRARRRGGRPAPA